MSVPTIRKPARRSTAREPALSLAARARSGRTGTRSRRRATARLATPCPHADRSIQYVISCWPSMTKLPTLPTSSPSRVTARSSTSGEVRSFAMCASKAARSSGSREVNAAIRTDSGSRDCANNASRSPSSTGRSSTATSAGLEEEAGGGGVRRQPAGGVGEARLGQRGPAAERHDGTLAPQPAGPDRDRPEELGRQVDRGVPDARRQHRVHRAGGRRVEDGRKDAAVHGAERVVVELLRREVHRDPALLHLEPVHPEHLKYRRRRQLAADHRTEQLQAAAPAEVRGVDRGVAPGEGAAALPRLLHARSLATGPGSVNQIQV